MRYEIIKRPQQNLISLDYVKNFLRLSHIYDDQLIEDLISAAIEAAENYLRQKLAKVVVKAEFFSASKNVEIFLPVTPVSKVEEVLLFNENEKVSHPWEIKQNQLIIKNMPRHQKIESTYLAGYADVAELPASIKRGIIMHVAESYDNLDSNVSISDSIKQSYKAFRRLSL